MRNNQFAKALLAVHNSLRTPHVAGPLKEISPGSLEKVRVVFIDERFLNNDKLRTSEDQWLKFCVPGFNMNAMEKNLKTWVKLYDGDQAQKLTMLSNKQMNAIYSA